MPRVWQTTGIARPVTARTLCATTDFFYDLPGRPPELALHLLPPKQALEVPHAAIGLAQLAGRDHVLIGRHRGGGASLGAPGPGPGHTGHDVQLAAELRDGLLAGQNALDRRPLELRAKHPPSVRLPWMIP